MPRTIPASLTGVVSASINRPIELYEVYLDTGTLYFAGAEAPIVFGTQTYTQIGLARSPVQTSTELSVDQMSFRLDNVDLSLSKEIIATDFVGRRFVVKKVFRENLSSSSLAIIIFDGRMDAPVIDQSVLTVQVKSWLDTIHVTVPRRVYSTLCNYQLYDAACTLNRDIPSNTVTGTATAASTATELRASIGGQTNYWAIGTLTFQTGSNHGLGREITASTTDKATIKIPFPSAIHSGDQFTLRRACRKTVSECASRFGNYINYGGFPLTPTTPILLGGTPSPAGTSS